MFGGTPQRNMVNPPTKNIADRLERRGGQGRRTSSGRPSSARRPTAARSSPAARSSSAPTTSKPRDPAIKGDKGVLMCFDEADGKFLWQAVHDKLPDRPGQRLARAGHLLDARSSRATASTTSATAARWSAPTSTAADGNQGVRREVQGRPTPTSSGARHDQGAERLPAQPGRLLAAGRRRPRLRRHRQRRGRRARQASRRPRRRASSPSTRRPARWSGRDNSPGKNIMHGQWSNPAYAEVDGKRAGHLPRRRRLALRLRAGDRQADLEVRLQPEGRQVYELGGRGTSSDFIATPVVYDDKVYIGVGQDPEHGAGVGHLWCIDLDQEAGDISPDLVAGRRQLRPAEDQAEPELRRWSGTTAARTQEPAADGRDYRLRPDDEHRAPSTTACVYVAELAGYRPLPRRQDRQEATGSTT